MSETSKEIPQQSLQPPQADSADSAGYSTAMSAMELPVAYELLVFDELENLRDKAVALAKNGAEEGTLIWAKAQTQAKGRLGDEWIGGEGDLHCSIILRPEFPPNEFYQMLVVASLSLGNAIASHLSPMIALAYGWPNKLLIANQKIAGLWLDCDREAHQWIVITCSVNIKASPDDFSIAAMSINEAEGRTELTPEQLLETYAREFISQINNWAERGFEHILNQWKGRMSYPGDKQYRFANKSINGILESIADNGDGCILIGEERINVSITQYMEID